MSMIIAPVLALQAQNLSVGSVVGSTSPTAPQSTGEIIRSTQTGLSVLSGQATLYEEVSSETDSPLLYPQIVYGQRFWFWEPLIWEVGVYAFKTSETENIFAGTNGDILINRQDTEENDYKVALAFNFIDEHLFKLGWNWNTIESPSETLLLGSNVFQSPYTFQAIGRGDIDQDADGPYGGLELNFPIDDERYFYFFVEAFGYFATGDLKFFSYAIGPGNVRILDGGADAATVAFIGQAGMKFFFYEDFGLKLGYFLQQSFVRIEDTRGFLYSDGTIIPVSQGKSDYQGFNRGVYIGLTGRY